MIGINDKGSEVFNTILFSAPSHTSRKIPSKEWDCLHISGLNRDGGLICLNFFFFFWLQFDIVMKTAGEEGR